MICGGLRTKGITKKSSEDNPLISVVTVVYNGEKNIEQTINSVLNQTYKNVEYIIIDGNSKDKTLEIIKKYEDRIDYWQSEPDKGIYDAMNKGIKLATGDYIGLLNADDWYENDTCEFIANKVCTEKADVYHGLLRYLDEDNQLLKVEGYTIKLINSGMIAHPTCFIKKSVYNKILYDTKYKSASDYDLIYKLINNKFIFNFSEKILTNFRVGGMSSGSLGLKESLQIQFKNKAITKRRYMILRLITMKKFWRKK